MGLSPFQGLLVDLWAALRLSGPNRFTVLIGTSYGMSPKNMPLSAATGLAAPGKSHRMPWAPEHSRRDAAWSHHGSSRSVFRLSKNPSASEACPWLAGVADQDVPNVLCGEAVCNSLVLNPTLTATSARAPRVALGSSNWSSLRVHLCLLHGGLEEGGEELLEQNAKLTALTQGGKIHPRTLETSQSE